MAKVFFIKNTWLFVSAMFVSGSLFVSLSASAQEYGFVAGFHQTNAATDVTGGSTSGVLNWDAGLDMAFELVPNVRFKTGAIYNERHVDVKLPNALTGAVEKFGFNFTYIDVPVNVQYNFNEMVGVFGGLVVGINVGDDIKLPGGVSVRPDSDPKSLIPLADAGLNFMFIDMIGFDLYYEYGLGDAANHFGKYNSFGGNFIYWF